MHLHPQGEEKFFRRNSWGKFVSALPPAQQVHLPGGAIKEDIFAVCQEDLELKVVVLDRVLEATSKKGRHLFQEKVHPQTKSWLRLCRVEHIEMPLHRTVERC